MKELLKTYNDTQDSIEKARIWDKIVKKAESLSQDYFADDFSTSLYYSDEDSCILESKRVAFQIGFLQAIEMLGIKNDTKKDKYYIRIGEIPYDEKSRIYRGDVIIGEEIGVSVYNCVEINGKYNIIMPLKMKEGQGITYEGLIQEVTQCRYKIEEPRKVYLVTGEEVGKGADTEPLLKNIVIIDDITEQFKA